MHQIVIKVEVAALSRNLCLSNPMLFATREMGHLRSKINKNVPWDVTHNNEKIFKMTFKDPNAFLSLENIIFHCSDVINEKKGSSINDVTFVLRFFLTDKRFVLCPYWRHKIIFLYTWRHQLMPSKLDPIYLKLCSHRPGVCV